jgi:hypothetical protein
MPCKKPAEAGGNLLVTFLTYSCLLSICFILDFGLANSTTLKIVATSSPETLTFIGLHDVVSTRVCEMMG